MELQYSLYPRVFRDDRYFNDLLSQLLVFRNEKTEAWSLSRFTPQIKQVVAVRAGLESGHWTPGVLSPWAHDLTALFISLASPIFLHLKLYIINGLVLFICGVSFLFFTVNLCSYIILKSYVTWTRNFCLCGMFTAFSPLPSPPLSEELSLVTKAQVLCKSLCQVKPSLDNPPAPNPDILATWCVCDYEHSLHSLIFINLFIFFSLFIPHSIIQKTEFFTEQTSN